MKHTHIALTLILIASATAAQAQPQHARLVVGGDPSTAAKVASTAREWLAARGLPVDEATSKQDSAAISACMVQATASQCKGTIAGTSPLWYFSVEADIADRSTNVVIAARLFDSSGALVASERQGCERCNDDSLARATHETLARLERAAETQAADGAALDITTVPSGAVISVAGEHIGKSPVHYRVPPGTQQVSAAMPGYPDQTQAVVVRAGEKKTLAFRFGASDAPSTRHHRPAWAWASTIGGGVALVTGAVLVGKHQAPSTPPFARQSTDLRTPGLILGGVGVAALGVGIWGLVKGSPRHEADLPRNASVAPFVGLSGQQATVGISGVFH